VSEEGIPERPFCVGGVMPALAVKAGLGPPRSECGVGALMPWADRLWAITYVSSGARSGVGGGLYEIAPDFTMTRRPESVTGTYANRYVHFPSNQLFIGPHVIDADRRIRTIEPLTQVRLTSTVTHLEDPERRVYVLGMEGEFVEVDVETLEVRQVADLVTELGLPGRKRAHFKAGYAAFGRVFVASNTYDESDLGGADGDGRLASWDGRSWEVLERKPFVEVTSNRPRWAGTVFATGWDRASALLKVFTATDGTWRTYRLPKASHTFDHWWQTEWPRVRETEHERLLADVHGMFYELSPWAYGGRIWGVRPISTHLWVVTDFCAWQGMLVMGCDNASPANGQNCLTAEPQSGLWLGKTDDLWQFGKPSGWGGPWWGDPVEAGRPSDPYLMTGFDNKCLHLCHDREDSVQFAIEVDFLGNGTWKPYGSLQVGAGDYVHHEFPAGYSAHWVRLRAGKDCTATAYFTYT
jgi:hypothetical protein